MTGSDDTQFYDRKSRALKKAKGAWGWYACGDLLVNCMSDYIEIMVSAASKQYKLHTYSSHHEYRIHLRRYIRDLRELTEQMVQRNHLPVSQALLVFLSVLPRQLGSCLSKVSDKIVSGLMNRQALDVDVMRSHLDRVVDYIDVDLSQHCLNRTMAQFRDHRALWCQIDGQQQAPDLSPSLKLRRSSVRYDSLHRLGLYLQSVSLMVPNPSELSSWTWHIMSGLWPILDDCLLNEALTLQEAVNLVLYFLTDEMRRVLMHDLVRLHKPLFVQVLGSKSCEAKKPDDPAGQFMQIFSVAHKLVQPQIGRRDIDATLDMLLSSSDAQHQRLRDSIKDLMVDVPNRSCHTAAERSLVLQFIGIYPQSLRAIYGSPPVLSPMFSARQLQLILLAFVPDEIVAPVAQFVDTKPWKETPPGFYMTMKEFQVIVTERMQYGIPTLEVQHAVYNVYMQTSLEVPLVRRELLRRLVCVYCKTHRHSTELCTEPRHAHLGLLAIPSHLQDLIRSRLIDEGTDEIQSKVVTTDLQLWDKVENNLFTIL